MCSSDLVASGLSLFVGSHARELVYAINQLLRFWHAFEGSMGTRPTSLQRRKAHLLQLVLVTALLLTPAALLTTYFNDPFSARYPLNILRLLLAGGSMSDCAQMLLVGLGALCHLRDTPPTQETCASNVRFFGQLRVLHGVFRRLLCPLLLPFCMLTVYALVILLTVIVVLHHARLPGPFILLAASADIVNLGLIAELGSSAAVVHVFSAQLVRRWRAAARDAGDEPGHRMWLRACAPLSLSVGPFFTITKTTTYKMVSFAVQKSLKAVLTFDKN